MIIESFRKAATVGYAYSVSPHQPIFCYPRRETAHVAEFIRRYRFELDTHSNATFATPEFLIALSLASSQGIAEYQLYRPALIAQVRASVPEQFLSGDLRSISCYVGLFGLPLPRLRYWSNNPHLTINEAQASQFQFKICVAQVMLYANTMLSTMNSASGKRPDAVNLALLIHGSSFVDLTTNEFRVHYRGSFLPDFIGYYNSAVEQLYQQKGKNNGKGPNPSGTEGQANTDGNGARHASRGKEPRRRRRRSGE